jgi:hypothetical protein
LHNCMYLIHMKHYKLECEQIQKMPKYSVDIATTSTLIQSFYSIHETSLWNIMWGMRTRQWSFGLGDAFIFSTEKRCLMLYNLFQTNEITIILRKDGNVPNAFCDIMIYLRGGALQCINECYPSYLSLHYVLFFFLWWTKMAPKYNLPCHNMCMANICNSNGIFLTMFASNN